MRVFKPFLLAMAAISGVSAQGNSAAIRELVTGLQGVDSALTNALEVVGGVGSNPLSVAGALPVRSQSISSLSTVSRHQERECKEGMR